MSERILIGLIGTIARDLLIVFIWHRVIAQTVPTLRAQAVATAAGVLIGAVMLVARWWTNLWRATVPAGPAIAVRLIVWAMFLVTAGFATAMDPRVGAVAWALVVSTGAPALAPIGSTCSTAGSGGPGRRPPPTHRRWFGWLAADRRHPRRGWLLRRLEMAPDG